jgi:hypothetical protein
MTYCVECDMYSNDCICNECGRQLAPKQMRRTICERAANIASQVNSFCDSLGACYGSIIPVVRQDAEDIGIKIGTKITEGKMSSDVKKFGDTYFAALAIWAAGEKHKWYISPELIKAQLHVNLFNKVKMSRSDYNDIIDGNILKPVMTKVVPKDPKRILRRIEEMYGPPLVDFVTSRLGKNDEAIRKLLCNDKTLDDMVLTVINAAFHPGIRPGICPKSVKKAINIEDVVILTDNSAAKKPKINAS